MKSPRVTPVRFQGDRHGYRLTNGCHCVSDRRYLRALVFPELDFRVERVAFARLPFRRLHRPVGILRFDRLVGYASSGFGDAMV